MIQLPFPAIVEAVTAHIRTNAAAFSPALARVQLDDLFDISRTAAQMGDRLPAIVVTVGDGIALAPFEQGPQEYLEAKLSLTAHYLAESPATGLARMAMLQQCQALAQLFTVPLSVSLPSGTELLEMYPSAVQVVTEFQEEEPPVPITWGQVSIFVRVACWEP